MTGDEAGLTTANELIPKEAEEAVNPVSPRAVNGMVAPYTASLSGIARSNSHVEVEIAAPDRSGLAKTVGTQPTSLCTAIVCGSISTIRYYAGSLRGRRPDIIRDDVISAVFTEGARNIMCDHGLGDLVDVRP